MYVKITIEGISWSIACKQLIVAPNFFTILNQHKMQSKQIYGLIPLQNIEFRLFSSFKGLYILLLSGTEGLLKTLDKKYENPLAPTDFATKKQCSYDWIT